MTPVWIDPNPSDGLTYATEQQLDDYADDYPLPDERVALLRGAERDLDACAFVTVASRAGAPKILPSDLTDEERDGLVAATCAQAMYRAEMGPEFFIRAQRQRVTTRAQSHEGKLPILGPGAQRELTAAGLWRLTTSSGRRAGQDPDRWQAD